jgi:hypothetical protein
MRLSDKFGGLNRPLERGGVDRIDFMRLEIIGGLRCLHPAALG